MFEVSFVCLYLLNKYLVNNLDYNGSREALLASLKSNTIYYKTYIMIDNITILSAVVFLLVKPETIFPGFLQFL